MLHQLVRLENRRIRSRCHCVETYCYLVQLILSPQAVILLQVQVQILQLVLLSHLDLAAQWLQVEHLYFKALGIFLHYTESKA